jgi:SAM-dependent methyltransferase
MSLLDVGCGPGTITADLARRVAPGPTTAVDTSPDVLRAAADEAMSRSVDVRFAVTDVHRLPFADDTFDVVHAHQVLQHVADPVRALQDMRRVCAPGGVVAARDSDYGGFIWHPALPELDEWLSLYHRLARGNGGEPDAGRRLLGWAQQAGYSRVRATSSTWCFARPDDRRWWGDLWADRVVSSAFAEQALASGAACRRDLDRIAAGWRRWAAAEDGWMSVPHGEVLASP